MCRGTFSLCKWWLYFDDCALHWGFQVLHFSGLKDNIYNFSSPLNGKKEEKREKNKRQHYKQTLITNISSVFQIDRNSEKENHGFFSIYVYDMAIYEGSFGCLFYKERITFGCTQYYDAVKVDGNVYCYFRYTMMQTFSF
jgi:hypothetical protein